MAAPRSTPLRVGRPAALALAAACALAACSPARAPLPPAAAAAVPLAADTPVVCRIGPDGGPDTGRTTAAERGSGGTGITAEGVRRADRGIGGTGAPSVALADRGIGGTGAPSTGLGMDAQPGTGIIGVITGFASICVGGREVGFDPAVPVEVDGTPVPGAALRVGQLAVIEAGDAQPGLQARRVQVRHEVSGPVQGIEENGVLIVAGQRVAAGAAWGDQAWHPGDWVDVSGLRDPDGMIVATRLDRRAPGLVVVHGVLDADGGILRIGALRLRPLAPMEAVPGQSVTAFGRYAGGMLQAESVTADVLAISPDVYFGPAVGTFLIESYATTEDGRLRFGRGYTAAAPGLFAARGRRVMVELQRRGDGSLLATRLGEVARPTGRGPAGTVPGTVQRTGPGSFNGTPGGAFRGAFPGSTPGGRGTAFEPAPMPDRAAGRPGFQRDGGRAGFGGYGPGGSFGPSVGRGQPGDQGYGPGSDVRPSSGFADPSNGSRPGRARPP